MSSPLGSTERLAVHLPSETDGPEVIEAALASKDLHHPWLVAPTTDEAWTTFLFRIVESRHHGFLLRTLADGSVVGIVNVSDIIQGSFWSAHLSYYAFTGHEGQGLMTEGVGWAVDHAFDEIGLHRLEANIQPGNRRSLRLAERCGFLQEGFSPRYLHIDGDWRDHERWALTKEDRPT